MNWIGSHGPALFRYSGTGRIHRNKTQEDCQVDFDVVQLYDGRILCDIKSTGADRIDFDDVCDLSGTTEYGYTIFISRMIVTNKTTNFVLDTTHWHSIVLGTVTIRAADRPAAGVELSVRFWVVNFGYFDKPGGRKGFEWTTSGRTIRLTQLPDYKEYIQTIRATNKTCITGLVDLQRVDGLDDLVEPTSLTTNLCWLLSLAQGCHIGWTTRECHSAGRVIERFHQQVPLSSPTGHQLIPGDENALSEFVESGLAVFSAKDKEWSVCRLIDMYVRGAMTQPFPEPRGLQFAALIDVMRGIHARSTGKEYLVEPAEFKAARKELEKGFRAVIEKNLPQVDAKKREKMLRHVGMFQWYPFSDAIRGMAKSLGLEIDDAEIKAFVANRDRIVHQYSFSSGETQLRSIDDMMAFCGKHILAILEYTGTFYDWAIPIAENWDDRKRQIAYSRS